MQYSCFTFCLDAKSNKKVKDNPMAPPVFPANAQEQESLQFVIFFKAFGLSCYCKILQALYSAIISLKQSMSLNQCGIRR